MTGTGSFTVTQSRPRLVLLVARASEPLKDLAAITLGWMCATAGVEFDTYYAADHETGGLFARHGSSILGGHHGARLARALAVFDATVVRLGSVQAFASLLDGGARRVIAGDSGLSSLYAAVAECLGIAAPRTSLAFDLSQPLPPAVFYPDCAARGAAALPVDQASGGERVDLSGEDPALACVKRHLASCTGIDLYEPIVASYMLSFSQRQRRLILPYTSKADAERRRDQALTLMADRPQGVCYGRWFGDAQLIPLSAVPTAYSVVEPHRHTLSVFHAHPAKLPQPENSWADLEPSDDELRGYAADKRILASWVLHSGELSHDDSVLAFLDWASMTRVRLGSGVHWQRYHMDPDIPELMHTPVEEGGVLGLTEPVLHSSGAGVMWETAGDPDKVAAMMRASADRIAEVAGARFAPRGVYCFGDHHGSQDATAGAPQRLLWEAIRRKGFEYVITSASPGEGRVLYRNGHFVVLSQVGQWFKGSPFVRGCPKTFEKEERRLAAAERPGWLIGAIDTPIHGCPIYFGRPYVDGSPAPRVYEFFDYVQSGGATGRVISATPRTVARYARLLESEAGDV